jgi:hypothetical protein
MTDEPTTTTYTDSDLEDIIERYPMMDERGEIPYTWDTSTSPPTQDANDDWIATYDLHSSAADVWEEKAAGVAEDFDFQADGGRYTRSQVVEQYLGQARWHRARRKPSTFTLIMHPKPSGTEQVWIANLAEERD